MIKVVNKRTYNPWSVENVSTFPMRCISHYAGRPSALGNKFRIGRDGTREQVIAKYRAWFYEEIVDRESKLYDTVEWLFGIAVVTDVALICWCAPKPCHAEVIKEYLEKRLSTLPKIENFTKLALQYMEIHNEASKKYKQTFSSIRARMWHDDDCHPLKITMERTAFIANEMGCRKTAIKIGKVYSIGRPLTVLDSFPDVSDEVREQLDAIVSNIQQDYQLRWEDALRAAHGITRKS